MRLGRYREVLGAPGVARLALFTTIGRLPFGILPFALVLLMREESYGYGEVGAVLAAEALAVGVTAAFVGRLIDRPRRRRTRGRSWRTSWARQPARCSPACSWSTRA